MEIAKFVLFLAITHIIAMNIFRLSTYHSYFWKMLPILIGYGCVVAWVLHYFGMSRFFLWQIVGASILLVFVGRKSAREGEAMLSLIGEDADEVRSVASSTSKTNTYFALSSIVYVVSFGGFFMWLYNAQLLSS